jgi:hypothetical protein
MMCKVVVVLCLLQTFDQLVESAHMLGMSERVVMIEALGREEREYTIVQWVWRSVDRDKRASLQVDMHTHRERERTVSCLCVG